MTHIWVVRRQTVNPVFLVILCLICTDANLLKPYEHTNHQDPVVSHYVIKASFTFMLLLLAMVNLTHQLTLPSQRQNCKFCTQITHTTPSLHLQFSNCKYRMILITKRQSSNCRLSFVLLMKRILF